MWVRRQRLARVGRWPLTFAAALASVGIGILVPAILLDLGPWWIAGVAVLAGVQVWAAVIASRPIEAEST